MLMTNLPRAPSLASDDRGHLASLGICATLSSSCKSKRDRAVIDRGTPETTQRYGMRIRRSWRRRTQKGIKAEQITRVFFSSTQRQASPVQSLPFASAASNRSWQDEILQPRSRRRGLCAPRLPVRLCRACGRKGRREALRNGLR
ncbi:hypothetical protein FA10DRAFT_202330 [Acaromyces ingoldii]|uniref:Uncharacterized protein n=1 Tax=Acaromyces ingoldii TaxID=215250 RepID=A0A316YGQ1_9BASI|nr:hypothetical protein FA10DRAFT_202330 [Acaromyces ingoldii]PWN86915.1 hypothetical protein FA10DRAFT_202330 [Acaromyces ingoldii]